MYCYTVLRYAYISTLYAVNDMGKYDQMLSTTGSTGITTNYNTAKAVVLSYTKFGTSQINVRASMLEIQLSNVDGVTKLYATVTRDAAGDNILMTETRSDIQTGLTTSTLGAASYRLDVVIRDIQDKTLYVHVRTNTGTCDVVSGALTYEY
tara:strand:- start:480 stop:932 length:453 start_codon:yes stop_codon:yes gene_type:complete